MEVAVKADEPIGKRGLTGTDGKVDRITRITEAISILDVRAPSFDLVSNHSVCSY